MKYLKFLFSQLKRIFKSAIVMISPLLFYVGIILLFLFMDGYTLEDFGFDEINLTLNDYCNLTDVDYTAVLNDKQDGTVKITEYLIFDVHAASKSNTFKELWRELPEDIVDGLRVTYDVESVTQILDDGTEIPYKETSKMYWEDWDYTQDSTMYWHHSPGSGRYPDNDESVLIYIPWTYREKMKFKIVYTMNNAAFKYNDCSELFLSMYSGNSITKLKSYKAQFLIPDNIMPTNYYAYTFGTSKSRIPFVESANQNPGYHTFSIDLDKSDLKFNYHNRYLEFCLLSYGDDTNILAKYAPDNLYSNEDVLDECIAENEYYKTQNEKYSTYKFLLFLISIIGAYIIVTRTKKQFENTKEIFNLYEPEFDYEYFRDIPSDLDPIFASELVFMKDPFNENREKKEEYAAILLSLVRKKYVNVSKIDTFKDWEPKNTLITIEPIHTFCIEPDNIDLLDDSFEPTYTTENMNTGDILEPLTTSERLYLELLERHSINTKDYNMITLSQFQKDINRDYNYTNSFVRDIESKPTLECGVMQGYFQSADYDTPKKMFETTAESSFVLSLLLLILANWISYFTPIGFAFGAYTILGVALLWKYLYVTYNASNLLLFTQYGINEQAKWYGLYNFLNSDTLINEKEVQDLVLWEKYLIYATAFGISEKVINAIKINAVQLNIDNSPILNDRFFIHSSFHHRTSRAFGHSIHTSSRGGGFGGFGGHGYGGGGRGGGGGSGGH